MHRKTSDIWQYCSVLDKTHAKCGLCKQKLSYKSSITNIKRHLARKHPEVCQYQVAETIEIKPIATDSEATYHEVYDENSEAVNNIKYITKEAATASGTFHIVPKAQPEKDVEVESPVNEVSIPRPYREIKRHRTSDIWQHCTAIDKMYAKCNLCEAILSYKTSITNIKKHLARKHMFSYPGNLMPRRIINIKSEADNEGDEGEVQEEEEEEPSTSQMMETVQAVLSPEFEVPTFLHSYSRKRDPASMSLKNKLDNKLLDLFIKDYQSFRIVEEIGFRSFIKSLNSSYVIPTKQQILKSLSTTYGKCLTEMKEHANEIKECCLTTECWTSSMDENYVAVTAHFIDEEFTMKSILLECFSAHADTNIAAEFQRITEEWGVDTKILLAVSDNDINVGAAMAELKWNHFSCFANTINYLVQEALLDFDDLLEKVKSIIFFFKSNANATSKLEIHQRNANAAIKPKRLLQDSHTWNTCLRMLERFVELEDAIKDTTLLYRDTDLIEISDSDWKVVHEICTVLTPFEKVANFMSAEKYTSASLVIVLTKELDDALEEMLMNEYSDPINSMIMKLKAGLYDRLGNVEISETLALCTYLDPRFKNLGFSSVESAEATKDHLVEMLSNKLAEQTINVGLTPLKTETELNSIWQSFKKRVSECRQPGTTKSRAIIEVERFLEDDLVDQLKNPLEWWREYKCIYPCMSIVAQEVMCALGTSIPCERIFSKAGLTLNARRNCLSSEEVKILTFLNSNSELYKKKMYDI